MRQHCYRGLHLLPSRQRTDTGRVNLHRGILIMFLHVRLPFFKKARLPQSLGRSTHADFQRNRSSKSHFQRLNRFIFVSLSEISKEGSSTYSLYGLQIYAISIGLKKTQVFFFIYLFSMFPR